MNEYIIHSCIALQLSLHSGFVIYLQRGDDKQSVVSFVLLAANCDRHGRAAAGHGLCAEESD